MCESCDPTLKSTLDLLFSWAGVVPQKGVHGHHKAGGAESTLGAVGLGNPLLWVGVARGHKTVIQAYIRNHYYSHFYCPLKPQTLVTAGCLTLRIKNGGLKSF